ncbi:MAG: hypothetical protein H8E87_02630 [FCB group bacterium]|nr:hypothetical protein [FCB group bacterium]
MKKRKRTKFIHEGKYAAEVEIEVLDSADEWSPYLSLEEAYKLDDVRNALRQGDIETAAKYGKVFELTPVG